MAHIKVKDPAGVHGAEALATKVVTKAKLYAKKRGVDAPKHVGTSGSYGDYIWFPYRTNAFGNCLRDAIKHYKLEVME